MRRLFVLVDMVNSFWRSYLHNHSHYSIIVLLMRNSILELFSLKKSTYLNAYKPILLFFLERLANLGKQIIFFIERSGAASL